MFIKANNQTTESFIDKQAHHTPPTSTHIPTNCAPVFVSPKRTDATRTTIPVLDTTTTNILKPVNPNSTTTVSIYQTPYPEETVAEWSISTQPPRSDTPLMLQDTSSLPRGKHPKPKNPIDI
ncbi:hypothetical protein NLI96_g9301 [Meripilus lineatus]|uniref:Uncharacterized protein n=1 Tax=Meripilus lineatus TaxID=2056292 RepID=A0AAD5UVP3_9APHY|nr:hypothetical protein NLI96_g9301 [Physisporinus lineatus]